MTAGITGQTPQTDASALADGLERLHVASSPAPLDSAWVRVAASPARAPEALATFALPVELVIRVLELAVDDIDRPEERAILLTASAKVSKAWRYAARAAFWRHVTLDGVRPSKWDQRFVDSIITIADGAPADPKALMKFLEDPVANTTASEDADSAFRQLLCAWSYLTASIYERRMMLRTLGEPDPRAATKNYTLKAIEVDLASMHGSSLVHFLQGLQAFASLPSLTVNLHPAKYYWANEAAPASGATDSGLAVSSLDVILLPGTVRRDGFTSEPVEIALMVGLRLKTVRSLRLEFLTLKIPDSLPQFSNLRSLVIPSERTKAFAELVRNLFTALPSLQMLRQLLLVPTVRGLSPEGGFSAGLDYCAFLAALPLNITHYSVRDLIFDSPVDGAFVKETFTVQSGHAVVRLFAQNESNSRLPLRIFTRPPRSHEWLELRHRAFPSKDCAPKHARTPRPRRITSLGTQALTKTPAASLPSAPLSFAPALTPPAVPEADGVDGDALADRQESTFEEATMEATTEPTSNAPPTSASRPPAAAASTRALRKCCIVS